MTERRGPAATLLFLVAVLEGYDLQVAGVAAPMLRVDLSIGSALLGWFFSASTIGLFFGALIGGRLADVARRRTVLVASVGLFGIASLLTGLAVDGTTLIAARFATGLGLGAALPSLLTLTVHAAAPRQERRAVAMLYCGVPIGGGAASLCAVAFGDAWQWLFFVGGLVPVALSIGLALLLNERERAEPAPDQPDTGRMFAEGRLMSTILLWTSFFCALVILYLILNWLPTLLLGLGLSKDAAFAAQMAFNAGGVVACAATASLLDGRRGWIVAAAVFPCVIVGLLAGMSISSAWQASLVAFGLGAAVLLGQSVLYGLAPSLYPERYRASGVGAAIAVGRLGSAAGPLYGASIIVAGGGAASVLLAVVPMAIIAGVATTTLAMRLREYGQ